MNRLTVLLLCFFLSACLFRPALAAPQAAPLLPFGEELQPLSPEELAEVTGKYHVVLALAALGAVSGTVQYLVETPRDEWVFAAVALNAAAKAVDTVFAFVVGMLAFY
ncbi:MAG TPA: hypothetical protein GX528_08090 [Firmicutes bacterium]|nr:hypothetical protein [Bacillota bacterium]